MHEKVAEYLKWQRESKGAERAKTLVELGISQRSYLPEGAKLTAETVLEYPYEEAGRRFKVEAVPVTDEEWAQIAPYVQKRKKGILTIALWTLGALWYLWGAIACLCWWYDSRFLPLLLGGTLGTLCLGMGKLLRS